MFTGLVRELGRVVSLKRTPEGAQLKIEAPTVSEEASVGDSISVNGVCLTVTEVSGKVLSFDLSHETLRSTNLGQLQTDSPVNLEPSLRPTDPLGGHIVTGHVDGLGRITARRQVGQNLEIEIKVPEELARYMVRKGSVAVDGISLTVVDIQRDLFKVVIIPHTARVTTIGYKSVGDTVNIETDIIGKYVERFLSRRQEDTLMKKLKEGGFL